ncbi:peptide deformylase [Candidatus Saccharibacteria bacterium]|nr:peptide deformylase [Candidatus Saccharibacteria bacterium]
MKKEAIITSPHPSLRQHSKRVGLITPDIQKLIKHMKAAMLDWETSREHEKTVGLAAVQVNRLLKLFIIRDERQPDAFISFINPEITKREGPIKEDYEGCLSVKDVYGLVPRHESVRVRALDTSGKSFTLKAKGDLARILQHEVDHTKGVLFIDHIKDNKKAFFRLKSDGQLEKLDYEKNVRNNRLLW